MQSWYSAGSIWSRENRNMDGDIDNDDLGLIKDYINGEAGDDFNKDIADTNGDSLNAITDVFFIQKFGGLKERGYLCR